MAIKTPAEDIILIPKAALKSIKGASLEELKILIHFFASPDADISDAARDLGINLAEAEKAVAFWRGAGIFATADQAPKKLAANTSSYRNYDRSDIVNAINNNADFALVKATAEQQLQKDTLTKNDLSTLLYLYDFAGIPATVLCGIITDCCTNGKANMQYIYKKAISLHEQGIDSYDKLEAYFEHQRELASKVGQLRTLLGFGDRTLTTREKGFFDCWFDEWGFSLEMVKHAYEITCDNTGKASVRYMNSILKRWNENGYQTVEDVLKKEASRDGRIEHSFDDDEFIAAALSRSFDD